MPNKEFVVAEVKEIIKGYFDEQDKLEAASSKYKVPLTSRLYNEDEVAEVVETLLKPEKLTL